MSIKLDNYSPTCHPNVTWTEEVRRVAIASMIALLASDGSVRPEDFERLLRRAATACWLQRFINQASKGAYIVSHDQIGETAGAVWHALSKEGPLTFAALMEEVNVPQSLFFMAVGWLSREEKLAFEAAGGDYLVSLM